MTNYVPSTDQLVVEVFVRDIERTRKFYTELGFTVHSEKEGFLEVTWEGHKLYFDEQPDQVEIPDRPQANVRVTVPDVDRYWARCQQIGARVIKPIADREYGLRDFTVADPDGFGVRFGTRI